MTLRFWIRGRPEIQSRSIPLLKHCLTYLTLLAGSLVAKLEALLRRRVVVHEVLVAHAVRRLARVVVGEQEPGLARPSGEVFVAKLERRKVILKSMNKCLSYNR